MKEKQHFIGIQLEQMGKQIADNERNMKNRESEMEALKENNARLKKNVKELSDKEITLQYFLQPLTIQRVVYKAEGRK